MARSSTIYLPALVAQLDVLLIGHQEVAGFDPCRVWQHSFMEIDPETFSEVILSLLLIRER